LSAKETELRLPRVSECIRPSGRSSEGDRILTESRPRIVVDAVFFQYQSSGIARIWTALLEEWAKSGFIEHVVLLFGIAVLMVEHVMEIVMPLADRVVVLDLGRVLFEGGPSDAVRDANVIAAYLGNRNRAPSQ
jgi:hypothetical protein